MLDVGAVVHEGNVRIATICKGPRHSSSGYSLASHRGGPGPSHVAFGAGAGFLRVLRFPLPIFIPLISPQSPSPIIRGWYNRPVLATVLKVATHK
jgi:hypothetical protein